MTDRRFYFLVGALALLLASVPYVYGALHAPPGRIYSGLTTNIDDSLVYLTWIRQAADGAFFQFNRFCVEPQKPLIFNAYFLLLGGSARLTHLPPIAVYHVARVGAGALLLWAVTALTAETVAAPRARRIAFALVCFSSGLGWLTGGFDPARAFAQPIDLFQTEAITFLSLYYSPLFAPALALMVVFVTALLRAERTGRLADIWPACVAGALLGNIHTYDIVSLFAVAALWRVADAVHTRRFDRAGWTRLILVSLAALPSSAYTAWATRADPLFRARAFVNEPTLTPALPWIVVGFGLIGLLALLRALPAFHRSDIAGDRTRALLLWAVAAIAVAYLPVPFQRKFLMGAHLPLCLLAGGALHTLTARLPGGFPNLAAFLTVLLTTPSNALFLLTDIGRLDADASSTAHRPYLTAGEVGALDWLAKNAPSDAAVLVAPDPSAHTRFPGTPLMPHLACYVPGRAGRIVYDGHWSETIRYPRKLQDAQRFFHAADTDSQFARVAGGGMGDDERRALLTTQGIGYVLLVNALCDGPVTVPGSDEPLYVGVDWHRSEPPSFLIPVYSSADITLYRVATP